MNKFNITFIIFIIYLLLVKYYLKSKKNEHFKNNKNSDIYKSYVINLDRSKDRLEFVKKNAKKANLSITRFRGVEGNKLDLADLKRQNIITNEKLRVGEIGCALSHINLWKQIINDDSISEDKLILILEDDVIIPEDLNQKLKKLLPHAPKDWELLFLGGCNLYGTKVNEHFMKPLIKESPKKLGRTNICTHAMLFKKSSIQKFLDVCSPLHNSIDFQLRQNYHKFNIYYTIPLLIFQNTEMDSVRRIFNNEPKKASKMWLNHKQSRVIIV